MRSLELHVNWVLPAMKYEALSSIVSIALSLPFIVNLLECGGYSSECVKLFGILSPHLLHHRIGI